MKNVNPEEVYLCVLCHYFVNPPAVNPATGEEFPPAQASQSLAVFLLREIKVAVVLRKFVCLGGNAWSNHRQCN